MKKLICIFILFNTHQGFSQLNESVLTLEEYIGYVKKYHPIVKQANLIISEGEAKLLKTRGAFDPKITVDFDKKKFKNLNYYNKLNSTFKIPTWYGIEFKATYQENSGLYLNPEINTSNNGLYSAGISVSLAKGLLTNKRMATLKMAKIYNLISKSKQEIEVNKILNKAIHKYLFWLKNYQEKIVYEDYFKNAKERLLNIKKSFIEGDKPAIDTLEASINLKNRKLDFENSKIKFIKSNYEVSNNLWLEDNLPLELKSNIIPDTKTVFLIENVLNSSVLNLEKNLIDNHPKLKALELKKERLTINKRLKLNNLLPKIDLQYNFLSSKRQLNSFNVDNYKGGLNVNFPLFLRKERGDLKLAKIKLNDIELILSATKIDIKNKIVATKKEIESYEKQTNIVKELVDNYKLLVKAEERRFNLGEGSLFLINYREVKLIEAELKQLYTNYKLLASKTSLISYYNKLI